MATGSLHGCGFYLPAHAGLLAGDSWPEPSWPFRFEGSEDAWITQTYLRLRRTGHQVVACDESSMGEHRVVIAHPARMREILHARSRPAALVVTAADKMFSGRLADLTITQNGADVTSTRAWVPHWPQPGIIGRDPERVGVRHAAFKGRKEVCHPALLAPSWAMELDHAGITWSVDEPGDVATETHVWSDFRSTDVVVALRRPDRDQAQAKPASKLVNAWLGGVPAVLGVEPQYRELRRSDLDYIEVSNPDDALRQIVALAAAPDRYEQMVDNGRGRACDFDVDAVTARWVEVLEGLTAVVERRGPLDLAGRRAVRWAYRRRYPQRPTAVRTGASR